MTEIYRHPFADKPRGYCVLCDGSLDEDGSVYAGVNHDGSGRLAHRDCWDNMVAQMWWSFRVSVPALADKEIEERKSARPKLGAVPLWGDHLGDMELLRAMRALELQLKILRGEE